MPEARRGPCKFQGNLRRSDLLLFYGNHAALQIFAAARVLHQESLPRCHQVRQGNQRTMSADYECLRIFVELRALPRGSVNYHRNVQFNPLAPPLFQPSFCDGGLLIVHTD